MVAEQVEKARKVMEDGGIVVFPTETAYGIAADATNPDAVDKVYEAKTRPRDKGLTAIGSSLEQAERFTELSDQERRIVEKLMPGPITLVSEKKEEIPDGMNEKFVFRVSSSEVARKLAEETPITATSANISGQETSYSVQDISEQLLEKVDFVIDMGELEKGPTSTIAELVDGEVVIHREGPIKKEEIEKVVE